MSVLAPLLREFTVSPAVQPAPKAKTQKPAPSTERFESIVDDYQRRLYGFALRMTGNREDAEEIVQDAFVRAYRALGKMSPEQRAELRLQPWLYTITLNVTRNRLRSKKPTNVALDALADPDALLRATNEGPAQPEAIVERDADMALVEKALLQLPMHLRAAATLRFIEGRSPPSRDCRDSQPTDRNREITRSPRRPDSTPHSRAPNRPNYSSRSESACVVVK